MSGEPRGGPQIIPRPAQWRLGAPAPWSTVPAAERNIPIDRIADRLARRGPAAYHGSTSEPETSRRSAVLCALFEDAGDTHVLLTRRSPKMRSHTHEIAFPGGRHDPTDATFLDTALREAEEEVSLAPDAVTIVGELDRFITGGSMSLVHPFVGVLDGRPGGLVPNPAEVEAIRMVPLAELLSDDAWREELWTRDGRERPITFMEIEGDTVWGATAFMLRRLVTIALDLPDTDLAR